MGNSRSFFDGLGEALNKTAKVLSDRASSVYESSKIRSRINAEERSVEKMKNEIGDLIFSRYKGGEEFEGEIGRLCEEINEHNLMIAKLESEIAGVHGKKICPFCGKQIPADAVFCPSCGESLPEPEKDTVFGEENAQQLESEDPGLQASQDSSQDKVDSQDGFTNTEASKKEVFGEEAFNEEAFDSVSEMGHEVGEEMAEVAESAFDDEGMMKSAAGTVKTILGEEE